MDLDCREPCKDTLELLHKLIGGVKTHNFYYRHYGLTRKPAPRSGIKYAQQFNGISAQRVENVDFFGDLVGVVHATGHHTRY